MAFCENCGNELPEGTKFCPNCGAAVNTAVQNNTNNGFQPIDKKSEDIPTRIMYVEKPIEEPKGIDKYGKYLGIVLFILALLDLKTDPAILTIVLSAGIIVGAIFCFGRKYKLKGFTVLGLIIAAFCLFCGVGQARQYGFLSTDKTIAEIRSQEVIQTVPSNNSSNNTGFKQNSNTLTNSNNGNMVDSSKQPSADTETKTETLDTANTQAGGVDPDLKAFLDSYEAYVDEYVDFMKKYNADPNNMINMLGEYTEIMAKYEDFAKKIDQYDSKTMSNADAAYYLEVTTRCSQKMLSIY